MWAPGLEAVLRRTQLWLKKEPCPSKPTSATITEACIHLSFNPSCAPASPEKQAATPNQRRSCVSHSLRSTKRVLLEFPLCVLPKDVKRHSKRRVPLLGRFPRDVVSLVERKKSLILESWIIVSWETAQEGATSLGTSLSVS